MDTTINVLLLIIVAFSPIFFLLLALALAKINIFFTIVPEGTAKVVTKGNVFERIIFSWQSHFMDSSGNIYDTEKFNSVSDGIWEGKEGTDFAGKKVKEQKVKGRVFGGIFWVGVWPFYKIHTYNLRWTDIHQDESGGFKIRSHEENNRDYIMLKPALYAIEVKEAETKPPERIRTTVKVLITMRITNPYNFLFVAPPTPLEEIIAKVSVLVREKVGSLTADEIIYLAGEKSTLWEGFKKNKLVTETLPKWGVRIAEMGIEIKEIGFPVKIQEAMEQEKAQSLRAKGRAKEIMGPVMDVLVSYTGRTAEEIQKEINNNPELRKMIFNMAARLNLKKLAMETKSYMYGDFPQGTTLEALLTLLKRMPQGASTTDDAKKERREATPEEKKAYIKKLMK